MNNKYKGEISLVSALTTYRSQIVDYIRSFEDREDIQPEDRDMFKIDKSYDSFGEWIVKQNQQAENDSVTFFAMDTDTGVIVGNVNVRTEGELAKKYGNIGYMVRPDLRGRGIGTVLVGLAVSLMEFMGQTQVRAVVKQDNIASKKALLNNDFVEKENIDFDTISYVKDLKSS